MKIAMIGHKRIPSREGGIEIVVAELSSRLNSLGHNVTAYNRKSRHIAGKGFENNQKSDNYNGVKLKWIPTPNNSSLNAIVYSTISTIEALFCNYDVIHFHAEGPASMTILTHIFHKKSVVTIHGLDWQRAKWGSFATKFLKFSEKTAAKYADEIIVLSKNTEKYFLDTYKRKTTFIPNGISKPTILDDVCIQKKYGLSKDEYILFLGRIVPEKGLSYLIDAYNKLNTTKKLVIAGGASHTNDYKNSLINKAKNNSNIIFTDFVDGDILHSLYSNAYIYCLPSDLEGMPLSLLEAMSYGNCCVTSDIPECTEVTGKYALHFKQGDTEDLKNILSDLLKDNSKVNRFKKEAANYILSAYNWDNITKQTLKLYE